MVYTKMSSWTSFATEFYRKTKKNNPSYKFKNALRDAAKVYKKNASAVSDTLSMKPTRSNRRKTQNRRRR